MRCKPGCPQGGLLRDDEHRQLAAGEADLGSEYTAPAATQRACLRQRRMLCFLVHGGRILSRWHDGIVLLAAQPQGRFAQPLGQGLGTCAAAKYAGTAPE